MASIAVLMLAMPMYKTTLSFDFGITLPQELCEKLGMLPGICVALSVHDGILQIVPIADDAPKSPRPCGLCKGEFTVPDDFNDTEIP